MRSPLLACIVAATMASPALGQKAPRDSFVTVEVSTVGVGVISRMPVVILHDPASDKTMPVWVGAAEAEAIARALFGIKPPRPMTHDLLADMIRALDARVEDVRLVDAKDGVYYGQVRLRTRQKVLEVDSRPSDAIALAMRVDAPIRVALRLLDDAPHVAVESDEHSPDIARTLGLTVVSSTTETRDAFKLPARDGVVVVDAGGEAADAGLRRGDLIFEVNGRALKTAQSFWEMIHVAPSVKPVVMRYWRGGKEAEVQITPRRKEGKPVGPAVPA
jgi:bifunctional DNase/RNase